MTWIANVWVRCSKPMKCKTLGRTPIFLRFQDNDVKSSFVLDDDHSVVFESTIKWKWKEIV